MKKSGWIVFLQGLAGTLAATVGFVLGTMICSKIPGTGIKYLNELGELYVGVTIFALALILAIVCRFRTLSLFAAAPLVVAFVFGVLVVMGAGVNLGLISEVCFISRHTALPVLCAALVFLGTRVVFDLVVKQRRFPRQADRESPGSLTAGVLRGSSKGSVNEIVISPQKPKNS